MGQEILLLDNFLYREELVCLWYFVIINPLLHRYSFYHINNRQLLKTLWVKKKLLYNDDIISLFAAELEELKIGM